MSWGERSCANRPCPLGVTLETAWGCNVDCAAYRWDGKTPPDTTSIFKGYRTDLRRSAHGHDPVMDR